MKLFALACVLTAVALAGCSSEVDKCVDAGLKSLALNYPNATSAEKAQAEGNYRIICLKAQSGK